MLMYLIVMENKMKKVVLYLAFALSAGLLLAACAGNDYNNYDNRSYNDRQVDNAIASEMNSLSDADIATLNKLK